jgi:hypothetical protein
MADVVDRTGLDLMKPKRQTLNSTTPRTRKPSSRAHPAADLSLGLENLTSELFFSELRVSNPASKSSYHVAIRGMGPGGNFCSRPDYAMSELGTCKHLEFTLSGAD